MTSVFVERVLGFVWCFAVILYDTRAQAWGQPAPAAQTLPSRPGHPLFLEARGHSSPLLGGLSSYRFWRMRLAYLLTRSG
jgi:hypothetical protein